MYVVPDAAVTLKWILLSNRPVVCLPVCLFPRWLSGISFYLSELRQESGPVWRGLSHVRRSVIWEFVCVSVLGPDLILRDRQEEVFLDVACWLSTTNISSQPAILSRSYIGSISGLPFLSIWPRDINLWHRYKFACCTWLRSCLAWEYIWINELPHEITT